MSQTLDLDVAQTMFAARSLERAANDPGEWFMQWGDVRVPAVRKVGPRKIHFAATFPAACYLGDQGDQVFLMAQDDVVGTKTMQHPGDTAFVVKWSIGVQMVSV